jgi:3-methyladenine DNA glycosylase AlkD
MATTRIPKKAAPKGAANAAAKSAPKGAPKAGAARMSLEETMNTLEKAGSEQTRKTLKRHGAQDPMFGVSFAVLKTLVKRIGADHELALALWNTGVHDARILAIKVADPARITPAELDRWAKQIGMRMCCGYIAALASESAHGAAKAKEWLAAGDPGLRATGWTLSGMLANRDETTPDEWFVKRLEHIEANIHTAPNAERESMNMALITIGGRNAALRKLATAAAKRIGKVVVDHGDTACKTPDAIPYIDKMWAHATSKNFESPAAQERSRESMRTRC